MMGVMHKSAQGWTGNKQAHTSSCLWNRAWLLLHAEHSTPHRSEPRESVTRSVPLPSSTHGMAHGTMHGRSVSACTANTRTYGFGEQVTGHMSQAKTKKREVGGGSAGMPPVPVSFSRLRQAHPCPCSACPRRTQTPPAHPRTRRPLHPRREGAWTCWKTENANKEWPWMDARTVKKPHARVWGGGRRDGHRCAG